VMVLTLHRFTRLALELVCPAFHGSPATFPCLELLRCVSLLWNHAGTPWNIRCNGTCVNVVFALLCTTFNALEVVL
jgi:hypothetical protein